MLGMLFNNAEWTMLADIGVVIIIGISIIVTECKEAYLAATRQTSEK